MIDMILKLKILYDFNQFLIEVLFIGKNYVQLFFIIRFHTGMIHPVFSTDMVDNFWKEIFKIKKDEAKLCY